MIQPDVYSSRIIHAGKIFSLETLEVPLSLMLLSPKFAFSSAFFAASDLFGRKCSADLIQIHCAGYCNTFK